MTDIPRRWTLDQFTTTIHQGKVGLWSWNPETGTAELDALARGYWGLDGARHDLETLFDRIDARDREVARREWLRSATSRIPYEFDFRLPDPNDARAPSRWISARGVGGGEGVVDGQVLAVFADVSEVRRAEEVRDLALREMTHRIGNLFAVASSVTTLSARVSTSVDEMARDLKVRFEELAGAFRYAADPDEMVLKAVPLGDLVRRLLAPHDFGLDRLDVDVPADAAVGGANITNVALLIHELATNALKHGALSDPAGRVAVTGTREGETLRLVWRETGGPPLAALPQATGFGARMIEQTVRSALAGTLERRVEDGALAVEMAVRIDRLAA